MTGAAKKSSILEFPETVIDPRWAKKVSIMDLRSEGLKAVCDPSSKVIGASEGLPTDQILDFLLNYHINHMVSLDGWKPEVEMNSSALILSEKDAIFNTPISAILSPERCSRQEDLMLCLFKEKFECLSDRANILDSAKQVLDGVVVSQMLILNILTAADEMISNAIKHNPSSNVVNMQHEFTLGLKDNTIVMICEDQYGNLDPMKMLKRVHDCFRLGVAKCINMGAGGAGIGSHMVLTSCNSLYLGINPGKRTIVGCVYPIGISGKRRESLPKNIHLEIVS